jgi:hypothetical protein
VESEPGKEKAKMLPTRYADSELESGLQPSNLSPFHEQVSTRFGIT